MKRLEIEPTPELITESLAKNVAGRCDEVVSFIKVLNSIEGPYSILLDAAWGDGKTFFVKSVIEVLKAINPQLGASKGFDINQIPNIVTQLKEGSTSYLPFYFNAWENDFADDPISALLACMAAEFGDGGATRETRLSDLFLPAIDAALALAPLKIHASEVHNALTGKDLIKAYRTSNLLRDRINQLAQKSNIGVADKLVIFIDELDRCRPDFTVHLLEQVKSLFQSENIIVVLSTDSAQLAKAIGGMYGPGFDSQHFLERFYDRRFILSHADGYEVLHGVQYPQTPYVYDGFITELFNSKSLTVRDYARVDELIAAGRKYCNMHDAGDGVSHVAKCIVVPLLIFLQREDIELFRNITKGRAPDALYEYGKRYKGFSEILNRELESDCRRKPDEPSKVTKEQRKVYMHNVCIALFATDRSSQEVWEAQGTLGDSFWNNGYDPQVFRELRFPEECYATQQ